MHFYRILGEGFTSKLYVNDLRHRAVRADSLASILIHPCLQHCPRQWHPKTRQIHGSDTPKHERYSDTPEYDRYRVTESTETHRNTTPWYESIINHCCCTDIQSLTYTWKSFSLSCSFSLRAFSSWCFSRDISNSRLALVDAMLVTLCESDVSLRNSFSSDTIWSGNGSDNSCYM